MRVTNQLFFQNTQFNYRNTMNNLYQSNQQLNSGLKIQHSYQDTGIYVDAMRLDYEASTLAQIKETSSKAQAFANNTDKALSQIVDSLDKFKTLAIQASSDASSPTSLNAIANDMQGILAHLKDVANTSINGMFLFSGSATDVKPIDAQGNYKGNGESLQAIVGSQSNLTYNIDGENLFLGIDSDYNQTLSTNVAMYNQSKLRPDVMVDGSGVTESEEVFLKSSDTIRDMIGDIDTTDSNDPKAVFYLSGRNGVGETFNTKISIDTSSSIDDLLDKIGYAYGNSETSKVVDVTMNDYGQIEIKDLRKGNLKMEMNLFGAIDRSASAGSEGGADALNLQNLFGNKNIQIIEFNKSNYGGDSAVSKVSTSQKIEAPGEFSFGAPMFDHQQNPAKQYTKLHDILGAETSKITFSGQDNNGDPFALPADFIIDENSTIQSLLTHIETELGVDASIDDNGQIILKTGGTDFMENKFHASMQAHNQTIQEKIEVVDIKSDALTNDDIDVSFDFDGDSIIDSTISVAITQGDSKDLMARKIADSINASLDPLDPSYDLTMATNIKSAEARNGKLYVEYNTNNNLPQMSLNPNTTGANISAVDTFKGHTSERAVNAFSIPDGADSFFKSFEKDGDQIKANVSQIVKETNKYATSSNKLTDVSGVDDLNGRSFGFDYVDISGNKGKGEIKLLDSGSYFQIDYNDDGVYAPDEIYPLFNAKGEATPANEVTYQQLMDVVGLALSGKEIKDKDEFDDTGANIGPDGNIFKEYQDTLRSARNLVEVTLDNRGRIVATDKTSSQTSMGLTLYDDRSTSFTGTPGEEAALSFMSNGPVKIVDPANDFFAMLDDIIKDVRDGNMKLGDNEDNPKSIGIQNAIDRISKLSDHVTKEHTKIGSLSNALKDSQVRVELLEVNVKSVKSEIIDADYGETMMQFQQLALSYQAMMSSVSKINSLSLVNFM